MLQQVKQIESDHNLFGYLTEEHEHNLKVYAHTVERYRGFAEIFGLKLSDIVPELAKIVADIEDRTGNINPLAESSDKVA